MVDRSIQEASLYWRKSSASTNDDCVEVATLGPAVLVRDSRDRSTGVLALDSAQWNALVNAIHNGQLDGR
ncbi:DUF397 domain-containing protein [Actinomadura sp. 3N407]|uniref:DUF397 domain-containing protein n=1 Tax=Actinomadura sp. 3N407 TaxID=3457423 RepID=UPI003FCD2432